METISSLYADFVVNSRFEGLRGEVVLRVKERILDLMGVSLAGYRLMGFPRSVVDYVAGLGGSQEATILQTKRKFPAIHAAFAHGACGHAIDMDDGHRFAALHPGTVIIPAALASAELVGADTKQLITGVVVGYEIMIRIGMAINPSSLNRGFHATGVTGPFGAAAAAANIMGLDREETVGALGLAGLQGAGLLQFNHEATGSEVKPISPAKAAMSGLLATILAKRGAMGPLQIFEGEDGFLKAVSDDVKPDLLTRGLGETYEIEGTYIKFFAACRHAHAAIDAAREAYRRSSLDVRGIRRISVETYPAAVRLAGISDATTVSAARFRIPFSVALAVVHGDAGADDYSEKTIGDERIQDLSRRVDLSVSPRWESVYPTQRGATVAIEDHTGRSWSADVDLARGEPENPATWEEMYKKFLKNAALLIPERDAAELGACIADLDKSPLDRFLQLI